MALKKELYCERRVFRDARTGHEVWQLTDWPAIQVTTYMYGQALTEDERYLVFCSNRGGSFDLYRLELATGAVVLLDEVRSEGGIGFNLNPNGEVFYIGDNRRSIFAVNVATQQRRLVATIDNPDWVSIGGIPGFSSDGRKVSCQYQTGDKRGGVGVAECRGSALESVFLRDEGIQHVQFRPGPGYRLSFAVSPDYQNKIEMPRAQRARAWTLDYETRRAEPFLVMPPGFRATHEYWNSTGTRLYFHKKSVPDWTPNWVCSIDSTGGDLREHLRSDTRRLGHSNVSRDERWIVSDSQDPNENELYLVNTASGASRVICWPNASINKREGQKLDAHVHPFFSPSGRMALYTSDASGTMQVYAVPLAEIQRDL